MSFDWVYYCGFADFLNQNASTFSDPGIKEAAMRSSMSRAYYAAYNVAFEAASALWPTSVPSGGKRHGWTVDTFKNYVGTDPSKRQVYNAIGSDLGRLHQYRKKADYWDSFPGDPTKMAILAVSMSNNVVGALKKYPPGT